MINPIQMISKIKSLLTEKHESPYNIKPICFELHSLPKPFSKHGKCITILLYISLVLNVLLYNAFIVCYVIFCYHTIMLPIEVMFYMLHNKSKHHVSFFYVALIIFQILMGIILKNLIALYIKGSSLWQVL